MKTFLGIVGMLIVVSLISAYIEANHCHFLTTTPPAYSAPNYIKTNAFCRLNTVPAVPGMLMYEVIEDLIDFVR